MVNITRVLVADDSPTQRQYLTDLIDEVPDLRVIGHAGNGLEAIALAQSLHPDIISMDIKMPRTDGLEATRQIMSQKPIPVVVVSGLLEDDIELSFKALDSGAIAVLPKPGSRNHPNFDQQRQQLITTLRAMSKVKVVARRERFQQSLTASTPLAMRAQPEIIAIGTSTGGPRALHQLLTNLPTNLHVPVVVVQHMPHEFIPGLARWLSHVTPLEVTVAQQGQELRAGQVIIAPGTHHLCVERHGLKLVARLSEEEYGQLYKPSVDVLFKSIVASCGPAAVGVIMTGMGNDGALGLLAMRERGAYTFSQDEYSSTVFGMPAAAIRVGAVEKAVSLSNLPSEIVKVL
ncbi:chemotaxis-specific protein-glutamate methyltransferase CheB [Phototrophicus methaneseepsis]|uniref:Protein-glutamate methylesterase/protein-glutamine glutaminase n=1 Tax=Phototrophicus methaneseepsis TaxID=2710758 RepID=A0A7S8ECX9_9CHLR|nr:chemotaxis-specific protein-glutamate methyltransferase CheB [Phototrophicus methaneseepsis]QPC84670.1 chemotaxis-specific protein-glutamate methyltransferase CheB [Phototrophicus methaneseepsis]